MSTGLIARLTDIRFRDPGAIAKALGSRVPGPEFGSIDKLMVIAADHPARGALGAGDDDAAMASRESLLERCVIALSRPGVNGFLGSPDIIDDLALLGALDGKVVWGSMNRGGLQGAKFEIDDRFTGHDARGIVEAGLDGGKLLLRIDYDDPATAMMLERTAEAVNALSEVGRNVMIEPFISSMVNGRITNDLSPDAVIRSIAISSALGRSSAHTWLKLPCVADMERVMESTTLPSLILGGAVPDNMEEALDGWQAALRLSNVKGLIIGRSLLYPKGGDVASAVDRCVEVL